MYQHVNHFVLLFQKTVGQLGLRGAGRLMRPFPNFRPDNEVGKSRFVLQRDKRDTADRAESGRQTGPRQRL